jgi:hypothetical protein
MGKKAQVSRGEEIAKRVRGNKSEVFMPTVFPRLAIRAHLNLNFDFLQEFASFSKF